MWPNERRFANLLTQSKRKWRYSKKRFKVDNTTYQPDFYLPNENLYIEVVGTIQAYRANQKKIERFKQLYPHIKFIVVDFNNNPYPFKLKWQFQSGQFVSISDDNHKLLTELSKKEKWTMKDLVDRALENYFKAKGILTEDL